MKTIAAIETPLKKLDPDAPVYARWPELLFTSRAIERGALRIPAVPLIDIMLEQTRTRRRANGPYESLTLYWDQVLFHERARTHLLALVDKDKDEGRPFAERANRVSGLGARHPQSGRNARAGSADGAMGLRMTASSSIIPATTST